MYTKNYKNLLHISTIRTLTGSSCFLAKAVSAILVTNLQRLGLFRGFYNRLVRKKAELKAENIALRSNNKLLQENGLFIFLLMLNRVHFLSNFL